ncbi:MAG: hypothetical protein JSV17_07860 [Candidatus Aminicenantes bacterium]|nr:MAG: hypothetical protein JSV17_07860 [Candidatus Aminicenantes bacterium]
MSKSFVKLLCFVVFFIFASTLLAIDVPLKYVKFPDKPKTYFPTGIASLKYKLDPPKGDWKLPPFVSAHPIYSLVKLGDEEKLLVLDRQNAEDEYYNRLYFDANANRDLTDDPVIDGKSESVPGRQYKRVVFPSVDTKIKVQGKSLPFSFRPDFMGRLVAWDEGKISEELLNRMIYLYLRVNCMYQGKFEIDGKAYYVYLGDANCNGLFYEKFALRKLGTPFPGRMPIFSTGDDVFISQDEEIDMYNRQVSGDWLLVKNRLFDVSISQAKKKMTLIPVTQNLVPLKLAVQTEHLSLYTEGGEHFLMTYQPDNRINIPKGKYRLFNYRALKKDNQGDLWSLSARATSECPWITIDGSAEAVLAFGEPYIVSAEVPENRLVNVQGSTSDKSSVYLSFSIRGQGNEDVSDLSHVKGEQTKIPLSKTDGLTHRPKEPTYTIVTADGKIAAQGSFEYG